MSRKLTYATFCSGIECMSVAARGLPLEPLFFSEIEPYPCAVLKAHYPDIPNLGDMSKIRRDENGDITNGHTTIPFPDGGIDILAAGCPCQDFSVAGKRAGGAEGSGTRSSLVFEFIRIIGEIRPRWFIYENVVGMLSTNEGRDFAHVLLAFRDCGYSVCYRTLDAQYVRVDGMERAVPQRRRRVWVVGCLGADESLAARVLFEPDCVAGHTAPRRRAGEGFAYSLAGRDRVDAGLVGEPAGGGGEGGGGLPCLDMMGGKTGAHFTADNSAPTFTRGRASANDVHAVALDGDKLKPREDQRKGGNGFGVNEEGAGYTLTGVDRHGVAYGLDARNTGLYGEKATGKEVSMTQDANQCKGGKCVVLCADGVTLDAKNGFPIADGVSQSLIGGTAPGHKNAVISTNSNGEDVAATLTRDLAKQTGAQQAGGGGVRPHPHGFDNSGFGFYCDNGVASTMKSRDYKDHTDLAVHEAKEGSDGE